MSKLIEEQIQIAEERLRQAMLESDVSALDDLLASELIFTNHLGQLMSKQDDLAAHRSGGLKIEKIDLSDQRIQISDNVSIVSVQSRILGNFGGISSESIPRFTRIWKKQANETWQVIAAHSSVVAQEKYQTLNT